MVEHTAWEHVYESWGHPSAQPLGEGMEGTVHRLGDGLVAKAWFHRTADELGRLRDFYDELAGQGLPFATPRIVEVREHGGTAVSLEHELVGSPLGTAVEEGRLSHGDARETVFSVVTALGGTEAGPATRALPVLDERSPPWEGRKGWGAALAALVDRRATRFGPVLREAVPGFDTLVRRVLDLLALLPSSAGRQVVHGDVCPENVLVDGDGRPVAVLDWGFLTTAGDNAFDAATASGFYDMYGPNARVHDDALTDRFAREPGCSRDRLLLYRAAYALAGANAYGADGRDGHFAWCAAVLGREDVRALLASSHVDLEG